MDQRLGHQSHNLEVGGSNPSLATTQKETAQARTKNLHMLNHKMPRNSKFLVKYSSKDGKTYGIMSAGYCSDEQQAISKSIKSLSRTNPNASEYSFAATRE